MKPNKLLNRVIQLMSPEQTIEYFRYHDDHHHLEYPKKYDYRTCQGHMFQLKNLIENSLNTSFKHETDDAIQDASFHSQIFLGKGALRFSNFGKMVCLIPDNEIDEHITRTIKKACMALGLVFIETSVAESHYPHSDMSCIRTWWIRYFDYL